MRPVIGTLLFFCLTVIGEWQIPPVHALPGEYLTPKEIEKLQDAQEISARVKVYLEAAALRLTVAQERLNGKESEEGDPLEFFKPEDMVDGYNQIMHSLMLNLDAAYQKPDRDREKLGSALSQLKTGTEKAQKALAILKKTAETKQNEKLWNLVNRALETADGAHEGAEFGLTTHPAPKGKQKNK